MATTDPPNLHGEPLISAASEGSGAELRRLPLGQLEPHPDYPRLVLDEEVVAGIAANLGDEYPQEHAILVRPHGDAYQIVSGRLRVEAARRKGLTHVWAWAREMDDDEAFMHLVTANRQGELAPLEIGLHALKAVSKAEGGRGRKGGVSAYAASLGVDESYVRRLVKGAEVLEKTPDLSPGFLYHAGHLAAAHQTHPSVWPAVVPLILEKEWSVKETEDAAKRVAEVFGRDFDPVGGRWWGVFLHPEKVTARLATDPDFTPVKVRALAAAADETAAMFAEYRGRGADTAAPEAEWLAWLSASAGGDSWRVNRLRQRHEEVRLRLEGRTPPSAWRRGDWRDHVGELADGTVAAVVTDPPYGIGYRPDGHSPIANDESPEVAIAELKAFLAAILPKLKPSAHVFVFTNWRSVAAFERVLVGAGLRVRSHGVWVKNNHGQGDSGALAPMHELILHATAGDADLYARHPDVFVYPKVATDRHPTEKPQALLEKLIGISTVAGDLVADPFGGVATTAAAAKETGRAYWSCELDDGYWAAGERRLAGNG